MPLITCEDCGQQISDKSAACIHCGCPTPNLRNPKCRKCNSGTNTRTLNAISLSDETTTDALGYSSGLIENEFTDFEINLVSNSYSESNSALLNQINAVSNFCGSRSTGSQKEEFWRIIYCDKCATFSSEEDESRNLVELASKILRPNCPYEYGWRNSPAHPKGQMLSTSLDFSEVCTLVTKVLHDLCLNKAEWCKSILNTSFQQDTEIPYEKKIARSLEFISGQMIVPKLKKEIRYGTGLEEIRSKMPISKQNIKFLQGNAAASGISEKQLLEIIGKKSLQELSELDYNNWSEKLRAVSEKETAKIIRPQGDGSRLEIVEKYGSTFEIAWEFATPMKKSAFKTQYWNTYNYASIYENRGKSTVIYLSGSYFERGIQCSEEWFEEEFILRRVAFNSNDTRQFLYDGHFKGASWDSEFSPIVFNRLVQSLVLDAMDWYVREISDRRREDVLSSLVVEVL